MILQLADHLVRNPDDRARPGPSHLAMSFFFGFYVSPAARDVSATEMACGLDTAHRKFVRTTPQQAKELVALVEIVKCTLTYTTERIQCNLGSFVLLQGIV
jgi:hypothetical protein